jgi:hypothetical protein
MGQSFASQNIEAWNQLVRVFSHLGIQKRTKNLLEIAGRRNLENVSSNILGFFLNPNEDHRFGDLVLASLLDLACPEVGGHDFKLNEVDVRREVCCTPSDKKLDIVVSLSTHLIGIENKIDAPVYNDLELYGRFLDALAARENKRAAKVLLTLRPLKVLANMHGFRHVRYADLFERIHGRKGATMVDKNDKYLLLLNDFMEALTRKQHGFTLDSNFLNFVKQNETQLFRLYRLLDHFASQLEARIAAALDCVKFPSGFPPPLPFKGYKHDDDSDSIYVSLDCEVEIEPGCKIMLALCLEPSGWNVYAYAPHRGGGAKIQKLVRAVNGKDDGWFRHLAPDESHENAAKAYQRLLDRAEAKMKQLRKV